MSMTTIKKDITDFLVKYSGWVHVILTVWNLLIVGWATGMPVNLSEIGVPLTIDVRKDVSYVQAHTHLPTWLLGVVSLAVNATIAYSAWKKSHVKVIEVPAGSIAIASPPDTLQSIEKKDNVIIKTE